MRYQDKRYEKHLEENQEESKTPFIELYREALEILLKRKFLIIPSNTGIWSKHRILSLQQVKIEGLDMPIFHIWRDLSTSQEIEDFQRTAQLILGKDQYTVIEDLINGSGKLLYHSAQEQKLEHLNKTLENKPIALRIEPNPDPSGLSIKDHTKAPVSWVPPLEWFPEYLKELTIFDITTLFPKAESEMLAIGLGRALVGCHNSVTASGELIEHTSRLACVIIGEDPGLGKSYFFNKIFEVMGMLGYTQSTFKNIDSQFNMADVVSAHVIYKDDISIPSLRSLLGSENTKIIATGSGYLRVEDKGVDAKDVRPIGTLFVNSNYYSDRFSWDLDPGIVDRIKMLSTYRSSEIEDDKRPEILFKSLSEQYGVSENVIIMYFLRLCVDKFYGLITDKSSTVNKLAEKVNDLTIDLRYSMQKHAESQILQFALYCYGLADPRCAEGLARDIEGNNTPISDLNWFHLLTQFTYMTHTRHFPILAVELYKHFLENRDDPCHPYLALRSLDLDSLHLYISGDPDDILTRTQEKDNFTVLTRFFKGIKLNNGLSFSGDMAHLTVSWRKILPTVPKTLCTGAKHSDHLKATKGMGELRIENLLTKPLSFRSSIDTWVQNLLKSECSD